MRKAVLIVLFTLTLLVLTTASARAGVTVSSPTAGSTVGSPVHVVANASSSNAITSMTVYVDNQIAYQVYSSKVDTYIDMSAGGHNLVVQAWDSTGAVFKSPLSITVSSTGTPPPGATYYTSIDEMTGWEWCDVCAGSGGSGPTATYSMKQYISTPSLDGKSAMYTLGSQSPYASALWWKQLGANSNVRNFQYDLYFYIKNPSVAQALEFDVNQSLNGKKFIFGTQCDIKGHKDWDVWDTANARWVQTGIPCSQPPAYTWNHLVLEFQRTSDGRALFVAVTLNGKKSYINKSFWPRTVSASELNAAFQMDANSTSTQYSVWLDKVKLVAW